MLRHFQDNIIQIMIQYLQHIVEIFQAIQPADNSLQQSEESSLTWLGASRYLQHSVEISQTILPADNSLAVRCILSCLAGGQLLVPDLLLTFMQLQLLPENKWHGSKRFSFCIILLFIAANREKALKPWVFTRLFIDLNIRNFLADFSLYSKKISIQFLGNIVTKFHLV